jgi:NAD(P)-dependent dehydrogenase (short-subunit alcohol dehydrogenase family)
MSFGDMKGRTCLVTGATSGHGRAMAHGLASSGAEVVLLGRNPDKCREVQKEIADASDGKRPEILLCDLASQDDVHRAADEYLASGRPLHVLVNNAGLVALGRKQSVDGHELCLAVNYLAMFKLTLLLLPRLRDSAPARIVNISSDSYKIGRIDFDDLQLEKRYSVASAYANSKLAIVHFTLELARRLGDSGVTVNAVDPGPVASNIGADNPGILYSLARPMIKHLFPSAARAARTAMQVACDPDLAEQTGAYFRSRKRRARLGPAEQPEVGEELWRRTAGLLGIDLAAPAPRAPREP